MFSAGQGAHKSGSLIGPRSQSSSLIDGPCQWRLSDAADLQRVIESLSRPGRSAIARRCAGCLRIVAALASSSTFTADTRAVRSCTFLWQLGRGGAPTYHGGPGPGNPARCGRRKAPRPIRAQGQRSTGRSDEGRPRALGGLELLLHCCGDFSSQYITTPQRHQLRRQLRRGVPT